MTRSAVLVTGMGGKIGQYFTNTFFSQSTQVFKITRKLEIQNTNGTLFDEGTLSSFDELTILHLASPSAQQCENDPKTAYDVNIGMLHKILDRSYSRKIKSIIYFSTSRIYSDNLSQNYNEQSTPKMENVYAALKYITERELEKLWILENKRFDVFVLRISNIVQVLNPNAGLRPLVNDFCWQAIKKREINIQSKKNIVKNFINIDDLKFVTEKILLLENNKKFKILNIVGPRSYSLHEIAMIIKLKIRQMFNVDIQINHNFSVLEETLQKGEISISTSQKFLNYNPSDFHDTVSEQLIEYERE